MMVMAPVPSPSQMAAAEHSHLLILSADSAVVAELEFPSCDNRITWSDSIRVIRSFDLSAQVGDSGKIIGLVSSDSQFVVRVIGRSGRESLLQYVRATGHFVAGVPLDSHLEHDVTLGQASRIYALGVPAQSSDRGGGDVEVFGAEPLEPVGRWHTCPMAPDLRVVQNTATVLLVCPAANAIASAHALSPPVMHAIAFDSVRTTGLTDCVPARAEFSPWSALLYVGCTQTKDIIEIDTLSWRVKRIWVSRVTPNRLLVVPGRYHLAALQTAPAVLAVWELDRPQKTAVIYLQGDSATALTICGSRFILAASRRAGGVAEIEAIDLKSMEKVLTARLPFAISAIVIVK
jgi:hypothetical protein